MNEHTSLYREPTPEELKLARLRGELATLREELHARELALGDLRGQLVSFEGRYLRQVGILYKQLDEWEKKITELHASRAAVEAFEEEAAFDFADEERLEETFDLKALFRELAKRIHPDFAVDDADAEQRTRLMAQANDAYNRADRTALERMLEGFDVELEEISAADEIARVTAQMERVRAGIAGVEKETAALRESETAKLQERVVEAARDGRDLLAEMAARVKGRIGLAMRQYELDMDRIKRPPQGAMMESLLSAATPTTKRFKSRQ